MKFRDSILTLIQKSWLALVLVGAYATFSHFLPDTFATAQNARNLVGGQSVLGIVALGMIIPLVGGHIDMSLGAVLGVSNIITASAMARYGWSPFGAITLGIVSGGLIGLFNGVCVAKVRVNALITSLGTATVLFGLINWYTAGQSIVSGIPDAMTALAAGTWLGIPRTLFYLIGVAALVWYLLEHTPYGRYLHAVGSNVHAARLVGIDVDRLVIVSFVIAGIISGLGGALLVAREGGGNPRVGNYYMLPALSAVFLGATSIKPGKFNVFGTLLAIFFLAISVSGLSLAGLDSWVEMVFNGTALLVAVVVAGLIEKRNAVV